MQIDFESDQQVIDNLEAVTYTSVATAGNTTIAVPDAAFYRTSPGLAEGAPSGGVYVKATGRFSIRPAWLDGVGGAKPADTITRTDGSVWTVLRAVPPVISVWQLDVIDLVLSNGLSQTGTLTRPGNATQDAAGRQALTTYTTVAGGVPCRVQPAEGTARDSDDRRAIITRYTAFLGQQVTAQAKDVFTSAGRSYTVLGFRNPQRIDELMSLDLELIDSPSGLPQNQSLPVITGGLFVGGVLTVTPGTWIGAVSLGYQWLSNGLPVSGATGTTYTTQAGDVGRLISVVETATNPGGSVSATSNTVGPIATTTGLTGTYPP
jgi:hypothetical protein